MEARQLPSKHSNNGDAQRDTDTGDALPVLAELVDDEEEVEVVPEVTLPVIVSMLPAAPPVLEPAEP